MSWKTKGGLDKTKYLHTDYLTADYIILKNAALGEFDISGNLNVSGFAQFDSSLNVAGDVVLNKTLLVAGNTDLSGNVVIKANLVVRGNVITQDNMTVVNMNVQNLNVDGNIYGNQYLIVDTDASGSYLYAISGKYGVNNNAPQATLDICGNISNVLNVFSTQASTTSVISQNSGGKGVQVGATNTTTYMKFYNENTIASGTYNGLIQYNTGGNLVVDVANNTQVLSSMSISQTAAVGDGFSKINGETLEVFGENNGGLYLNEIYGSSTAYTGSSISCVAKDNYSTTKVNIVDPSGVGLTICGGPFPDLSQNSMGAIGWTNTRGEFIPDIVMIGNGSLGHQRTTVGINSYSPDVSGYSMHINGPVKITNGEINRVANIAIEAKALSNMLSFGNMIICVGSPSATSFPFTQNAYYSLNGGQSWTATRIANDPGGLEQTAKNMNTATYYSGTPSFAVIAGDGGYIYNTTNGLNYYQIAYGIGDNWTASYITSSHITLAYGGVIKYFSYSSGDIGVNGFNPTYYTAPSSGLSAIYQMNASGNNLYVAGIGGIVVYDITSGYPASIPHTSSLGGYTINSIDAYSTDGAVGVGNEIIVYTTDGGSSWNTVTVPFSGIVLTSVYVYNSTSAIAVGYTSTSTVPVIFYTTTVFASWTRVEKDVINNIFNISGSQKILFGSGSRHISIVGVNADTMILATRNTAYASGSTLGQSSLYYLYLPDLFNGANNKVMDIYGNVAFNGNIGGNLNVTGVIKSNYIDKFSGGNLYIGAKSNGNINIGDFDNIGGAGSGKKINIGFNGDSVYIGGSVYLVTEGAVTDIASSLHINSDASSNSITSGALTVDGGAGIGGNINIGGSDSSILGNLSINKTTNSTNISSGALTVSGGVGIGKSVFIGENIDICGNIVVRNHWDTNSIILYDSTANTDNLKYEHNGNLVHTKGAAVNWYITQDGSASFVDVSMTTLKTGSLSVTSGFSISNTTESTSTTTGAFTVPGGLGVAKNTYIGGNTDISGNLIVHNHWDSNGMILYDTSANTDNLKYTYNGNLVHTKSSAVNWYITQDGSASFVDVSMTTLKTGSLTVTTGFSISATTESTSTTTGAFTVPGGLGVAKNTYIGGNLDVSGSMIVRNNWDTANPFLIYDTATNTSNLRLTSAGNLIYNNSGVKWSIDSYGNLNAGNAIITRGIFTDASLGTVSASGKIYANDTTASTSSSTGALIVAGGAGVTGALYTGGSINIGNAVPSTAVGVGALIVSGANAGASVAGNIYTGGNIVGGGNLSTIGNINIQASTNATSNSSGALIVAGGAGIAGALYTGGSINIGNAVPSTAVGVGALIVSGANAGASVAGNVYIGGNIVTTGNISGSGNLIVNKTTYLNTSYGVSNTPVLVAVDSTTSSNISFYTASSATSPYNPILANNYQAIVAGNSAANGTSTMALTTSSVYNTGILIDASSVVMGAANNSTTGRPLNRIEINKTVGNIDISASYINVIGGLYVNGSQINSNASGAPGSTRITADAQSVKPANSGYIYDLSYTGTTISSLFLQDVGSSYMGLLTSVNNGGPNTVTIYSTNAYIIGDGTTNNSFVLEPYGTVTLQFGYYISGFGYWIVLSKWNNTGNLNAIGLVATGGVASTSTTTGSLIVSGGAGISGALYSGGQITGVSFNATSDYRIKEVEYDLAGSRDNIDMLRPIKYINKITGKEDFGFLAHEVQEIFPFLVDGEKDGDQNQTLNYIGLIGLLVNEVKTLKKENKTLTEDVATIKRELGL